MWYISDGSVEIQMFSLLNPIILELHHFNFTLRVKNKKIILDDLAVVIMFQDILFKRFDQWLTRLISIDYIVI